MPWLASFQVPVLLRAAEPLKPMALLPALVLPLQVVSPAVFMIRPPESVRKPSPPMRTSPLNCEMPVPVWLPPAALGELST